MVFLLLQSKTDENSELTEHKLAEITQTYSKKPPTLKQQTLNVNGSIKVAHRLIGIQIWTNKNDPDSGNIINLIESKTCRHLNIKGPSKYIYDKYGPHGFKKMDSDLQEK